VLVAGFIPVTSLNNLEVRMKKIITVFATLLLVGIGMAGDAIDLALVNKSAVPATASTPQLNGFVDSIYIDVTGTTTGTLSVTSGTGELIYSNTTAITADTTVRPRKQVQDTAGVALGYATNAYERILLVNEKIFVYLSEAAGATNTYYIKIRLSDK